MKLDIGPSPFQCNLNIWDQLAPTAFLSTFLSLFSSKIGRIKKVGPEGKLSSLFFVSPIFFPQPNSGK